MEKRYATLPRQTNLAYQMQPEAAPKTKERILREPRKAAEPRERARINWGYIVIAVIAAALLVLTVSSYAQLAELNTRAAELEKEYNALCTEADTVAARQEQTYDLTELAEYAETHLGMVKQSAANVEFIDLGEADQIIVNGSVRSESSGFFAMAKNLVAHLVEYFR